MQTLEEMIAKAAERNIHSAMLEASGPVVTAAQEAAHRLYVERGIGATTDEILDYLGAGSREERTKRVAHLIADERERIMRGMVAAAGLGGEQ